jgi:hypothetical protein
VAETAEFSQRRLREGARRHMTKGQLAMIAVKANPELLSEPDKKTGKKTAAAQAVWRLCPRINSADSHSGCFLRAKATPGRALGL